MKPPFRRVLCPTDLSEVGNMAVPVAFRLVEEGGVIHLLHVAEPPFQGNPLYAQYVTGWVPTPDETAGAEDRARKALEKLRPKAAARGIEVEHRVVHSADVAEAVAQAAKEVDAEAIVMGTRGRTGFARLLLGSVAKDILSRRLPVILVHSRESSPSA